MPDASSWLAATAELERRYDGPIPPSLLLLARHCSAEAIFALRAEAEAAFFRRRILDQLRALRLRRDDPGAAAILGSDLALYLRQWRRWRRATLAFGADLGGAL